MNIPLVTIGIPFFNAEQYLKDAILSVINQTYSNWELILVNDGSSDNFQEIIAEFNDDRIRLIDDGKHMGLPKRLNQTALLAKGMFYARMDADDIMHYDRIKIQIEYLILHPSVDVIGSHSYCIDSCNNIIGISKNQISNPKSINDILSGGAFIHPTVMARTGWFLKNCYDESLLRMQDLALWLKTVTNSNFYILPNKLLYYRAVDNFTLSKYLNTQKYFRRFVLHNNCMSKHKILVYKLYFFSLCKSIIYRFFDKLGMISFLISKRYNSLPLKDFNSVQKDMLLSIKK